MTTLFLGGGAYEVLINGQSSTVTKYYAIAGQRVMRDSSGLHYLLTDHLGSVVAVLDGSGDLETDERYLPFGGLRDSTGISETDFAFTGQRNLSDVGLMDYNARWYLSSTGRFISADSIVPNPGNPQALNRYAYVFNSPLSYVDDTGYFPCLTSIDGYCPGNPIAQDDSKDLLYPWQRSDNYNPETGEYTPWGIEVGDPDDERVYLAGLVKSWIWESGGYWGPGPPTKKELSAWLLDSEALEFFNQMVYELGGGEHGAKIIVNYMQYRFEDGISAFDLSLFTPVFHSADPKSVWDMADQDAWMTDPDPRVVQGVENFWGHPYMYHGWEVVWWNPNKEKGFGVKPFYTVYKVEGNPKVRSTWKITNEVVLHFGLKPAYPDGGAQ